MLIVHPLPYTPILYFLPGYNGHTYTEVPSTFLIIALEFVFSYNLRMTSAT